MNKLSWLILAPMRMEAKAISDALGGPGNVGRVPVPLGVPEIWLHIIGVGARLFQPDLPAKFQRVVLAGLGGALSPELQVGDVVADGSAANDWPDVRRGSIFGADQLITSASEKQTLFTQTGCIAVDMESSIIRPACQAANIPFLHLRAISDCADEALPDRMPTWIDELGEPKLAKVAADVAFHPQYVPLLMRLQKNSALALRNLSRVVKQIVENSRQL